VRQRAHAKAQGLDERSNEARFGAGDSGIQARDLIIASTAPLPVQQDSM
jgi:hypothetical protein